MGAKSARHLREAWRRGWRAEGWTTGRIAAAMAERCGVKPLVAFRYAHGLSQAQVADAWNAQEPGGRSPMTAARLSDWERWPQGGRRPTLEALDRLARIYHTTTASLVDGEDFTHLDPAAPSPPSRPAGPPPEAPVWPAVGDPASGRAAGRPDPAVAERLAAVTRRARSADHEVVSSLRRLLAEGRRIDDTLGGRHLLVSAGALGALVERLLRDARARTRVSLLSLAGQYDQFAGWLSLDAGDHATARRRYDRALDRAIAAGDAPLTAYVLTRKAELAIELGDHRAAATLAEAAGRDGASLTPLTRAWTARVTAWAQARLGEQRACRRQLDVMVEQLSLADDRTAEPDWLYWFSAALIPICVGSCYLDLGLGTLAVEALDRGLAVLPPTTVRDRGTYAERLARAHLHNGDVEQACAAAQRAAALAAETGSVRVAAAVGRLRERLAGSGQPGVTAGLDELLNAMARPSTSGRL